MLNLIVGNFYRVIKTADALGLLSYSNDPFPQLSRIPEGAIVKLLKQPYYLGVAMDIEVLYKNVPVWINSSHLEVLESVLPDSTVPTDAEIVAAFKVLILALRNFN